MNSRHGTRAHLLSEIPSDLKARSRINALTIDVEDWYHPELVRNSWDRDSLREDFPQIVPTILDLLDRYHVKITFFILGECASQISDTRSTDS